MAAGKDLKMTIKIIGALLVIIGCGGFGLMVANELKKECNILRDLITALEFMRCEITYRMTSLPELFYKTSSLSRGRLQKFFTTASEEMKKQTLPCAKDCINLALQKYPDISASTKQCIQLLGETIGVFDLHGQITVIESVQAEATRLLNIAYDNQNKKFRCYQTLGLSAGAALVILFI